MAMLSYTQASQLMNASNASQIGSQKKKKSKESHADISEALVIVLKNNRITFGDLYVIQNKVIATYFLALVLSQLLKSLPWHF